jgi:ribosomal subunit interface protein
MTLQVTGKNVEVGEAFQTYVADRLALVLGKYIGPQLSGHVRVEKERGRFHTGCSVRLRTGLELEATGEGGDAYASADSALDRLEKRVRRYKRRLKKHHSHAQGEKAPETSASDYVVQVSEEQDSATHDGVDEAPVIVAETELRIGELAVSEAVMRLDLTEAPFLVFRNAANGEINVVYRRPDGNVGWIDPKLNGAARLDESRDL